MKNLKNILAATVAAMFTVVCLASCIKVPKIEAGCDKPSITTSITTTVETTVTAATETTTSVTTSTEVTTSEIITEIAIETVTESSKLEEPVTEPQEVIVETESTIQEIVAPVVIEPEYIVYKPSTHYIHRNSCYWAKTGDLICIENTEGIEARKCTECNPEMDIINEYVEPEPEIVTLSISDYDFTLLCEIVEHEAGSDRIGTWDKACVAAGVMNRVKDSRFPDTVYGVLTQPKQFEGYYPGCTSYRQGAIDAVNYYLSHPDEFGTINSWYGDGYRNYFSTI